MSKQWPFPHYIDVCHGNVDYFEWKNVYLIYLWWMDCNLWLLQFSCNNFIWGHLLSLIAFGEDLVPFLQGSSYWFCSYLGEGHNILYKLNNDAYETLKIYLKHPLPLFIYLSGFGSIWEAIFSIYLGGNGTPIG